MDADYAALLANVVDISVGLALGLLIGSERGWHGRIRPEGARSAGIRTFAALALLGGLVATAVKSMSAFQGWLICALVFMPVSILLVVSYWQGSGSETDRGITTEVAAMVTYWLGALPAFGLALPAAGSAVILALLLHLKGTLHELLARVSDAELLGTLQFLLVSVVLLPLLPDDAFGPWGALNPYELWWMVVLISGLSLVGYFAMRITGPRRGVLATSVAGGLVSSTAVTLSLSRMHREVANTQVIAAGILLACAIMFARILIVITAIRHQLLGPMLIPAGLGFLTLFLVAWWHWRQRGDSGLAQPPTVRNPFQLIPALQFGALLALVMLAADALQHWFGHSGIYLLSLFTGIADVDAIVLSLGPKAGSGMPSQVVILAIAVAAATNTLMKALYCRIVGGAQLGNKVLPPAALSAALVMASAWLPLA